VLCTGLNAVIYCILERPNRVSALALSEECVRLLQPVSDRFFICLPVR